MTGPANSFGRRGGGGRRTHERMAAGLPAQVISLSTRHRALLMDVSVSGARVRVEDPPKKGAEVFLMVRGLDLFARIVWKSGEYCGLRFDRELRAFDVELLRREAAAAEKLRLTPAQKGGVDDWTDGVAR